MAQIYSNAYVTILASSAGYAAHGFLAHRYENDEPTARIPFRVAPNKFGSITARKFIPRSSSVKENNPLSTRAWALQEQMMASRILAYTKHTLEWRCASSMMSLNDSLNVNPRYAPAPQLISQLSTNPEEAISEWSRILGDYSRRFMSIQSDKLPAIAALAERFAAVLGRYHAGLWRYGFIRHLCWISDNTSQERRAGSPYRAPSWSWASVNGIFPVVDQWEEDCCILVLVRVLPKNAEVPYGEVIHALIKISGIIIIASIAKATEATNPMCTLIRSNSMVTESALQRFYNTYFHRTPYDPVLYRSSAIHMSCFLDSKEFRSEPLIVCEFLSTLPTPGEQL